MRTCPIEVNETAKAFNVNGVAVAKRHLRVAFKGDTDGDEAILFKYLATIPVVYAAIQLGKKVPENAGPTTKYLFFKTKRIWEKLGLDIDAAPAFMAVTCQIAEAGGLTGLAKKAMAEGNETAEVIPFPAGGRPKPTVH